MMKICAQTAGFGLALAVLSACGSERTLQSDPPIPEDHPAAPVVYNEQLQQEIVVAMEEVHLALIKALVPSAQIDSMRTLTASRGIRGVDGIVSCKPDFDFAILGINIGFPSDPTCAIGGDVLVRFIPLGATVDLQANNLSFVKSISFDADIDLGGGSLDIEFLDGGISLFESDLIDLSDMVINGRLSLKIGGGFSLEGRTNVFDRGTGIGAMLKTNLGGDDPGVQACFLSGGDPMDPDAGDADRCFGLGG